MPHMSPQRQTVDIEMGDTSSDHPLFDVSIEAINYSLLEDHQRAFDHVDASSLLDLLTTAAHASPSDRTLVTSSRKFTLFVRVFAAYFDVLSIYTRVKAEWPGPLWTLVRLVFQVASDYVLFLEKIADIFEAMANILSPYHKIYTIRQRYMGATHVDAEHERLATLMSYAYADMIKKCLEIYCTLFRNMPSMCATPNIAWSEHWPLSTLPPL